MTRASESRRNRQLVSKDNTVEAAHARLSPSSCSRWFNCPGSVKMMLDHPEEQSGNHFAYDGTILHGIMEDCLRYNRDPYEWLNASVSLATYRDENEGGMDNEYFLEITEDLCDILIQGLDEIDSIPGEIYIENRVSLNRWMPDQFGTLDVGIIGKRRIHIWDHKFGMVPVSPVRNKQISCYALGFWENIARHVTDVTEFRFHVWQPRCFAGDGGGTWDVSLDELLAFGKELQEKARATDMPDAPRIPGPAQCQYCEGAKQLVCKEYYAYNKKMLFGDDDDEIADNVAHEIAPNMSTNRIDPEERSYIIQHRPMINKFLDRLAAEAIDDGIKGAPTPGLKPVYGRRPPRKWKDKERAETSMHRLLGDDGFTRKVLSPTQAQAHLSETMYGAMVKNIEWGDAKPILVPEEDGRERIQSLRDIFNED